MTSLVVRPGFAGSLALGLAVVTSLLVLFVVGMDQGAALAAVGSALDGATTHELFHDARHLLGVPCH